MVTNFTANKLTVNTLVVNSSGIVNVADTLTAGNIQLFASQLTAGTIITDGDIGRDYLDDRIKATTGNLEARNVKGLDITVAKNLIASGDVRVYDRVTVNGDLTAKNVTALRKGITVGGNLVANNVDAQNTNNSADGGKITAGSIDATGKVSAKENVNVTNTLDVGQSLEAQNTTAATVILHKDATATGNIATDTLQVDPETGAATLTDATVTARTAGGKVNITNARGVKIRDTAQLAAIAEAADLSEGSYTSHISENWRQAVAAKLDPIDYV